MFIIEMLWGSLCFIWLIGLVMMELTSTNLMMIRIQIYFLLETGHENTYVIGLIMDFFN